MLCAVVHVLTKRSFHFVSKLDQMKHVHLDRGQACVIDEVDFQAIHISDAKNWLDLEKPRQVHCRNFNGFFPAKAIRVLSTNESQATFWPPGRNDPKHCNAINRRHVWVDVSESLIKAKRLTPEQQHRVLANKAAALAKKLHNMSSSSSSSSSSSGYAAAARALEEAQAAAAKALEESQAEAAAREAEAAEAEAAVQAQIEKQAAEEAALLEQAFPDVYEDEEEDVFGHNEEGF